MLYNSNKKKVNFLKCLIVSKSLVSDFLNRLILSILGLYFVELTSRASQTMMPFKKSQVTVTRFRHS